MLEVGTRDPSGVGAESKRIQSRDVKKVAYRVCEEEIDGAGFWALNTRKICMMWQQDARHRCLGTKRDGGHCMVADDLCWHKKGIFIEDDLGGAVHGRYWGLTMLSIFVTE
jgi:hypothetical protein